MGRWARGEETVQYLVGRNRLESFEAKDLGAQDRQERWGGLSAHYLKNTLQSADS